METPMSTVGKKSMGSRKGSGIDPSLQNYLEEVDDGWDDDFMERTSESNHEDGSLRDLFSGLADDRIAFEFEADLGLLNEADKESDITDLDDEDWDIELDLGSAAEPPAKITLAVDALLDKPTAPQPNVSYLEFLKNPTPHEFTMPLLKHLPQPPTKFTELLARASDAPLPPPPSSPGRVRTPPAESNAVSTVIAKLSNFAQIVEFAPFELSRQVIATVEPPEISRTIAAAQVKLQEKAFDDCLSTLESLMDTFYAYMSSYECNTCWILNNIDDDNITTVRGELESLTDLSLQLCQYWMQELKAQKMGNGFERAVAQYLRSCHLQVRMAEINGHLNTMSKALALGENVSSQLRTLFIDIENISGFPDILIRAKHELMAIILADILFIKSSIVPLTGIRTQPVTPRDNGTPDFQRGIEGQLDWSFTRINSVKSFDDLESESEIITRARRRSLEGIRTGLRTPITTSLTLLKANKLPAHTLSKLCLAVSSYLSAVWAAEIECVDDDEVDNLLSTCRGVDEKQILESLLYESVEAVFESEPRQFVASPTNFAHSDEIISTLPSFTTLLSYASMRMLADYWVKTKPLFALYMFPVCISMLHRQNKPIERRTLQKELAILSATHKDTERAIIHCTAVLEDARALGELSEVVFVTDLLVSQHCDQGTFEEAIRVLQDTLTFLNPVDNQPNASVRRVQSQMHADTVHARLAHVYMLSGSPEIAAIEFERLYNSLKNRPESSAVVTKTLSILSWIAKAHLKANNLEDSSKAIRKIKELRERTGASNTLRSSAGILNATHMWWGFRADALESCLPKYCVSSHNADLGALSARLQYRNGQFVEALKNLVPTIIAVELATGDKTGPQNGVVELGRLYDLRGKIQLAAASNSARTKFPFHLGGEQIFSRVLTAYEEEFSKKNAKKSTARIGVDLDVPRQDAHSTCSKARRYRQPSDLLRDAMKWFKRAWECFKAGGDKVRAARAASGVVKVYLQAVYVPVCLLKIQPPAGWSPSAYAVRRVASSSPDPMQNDAATPTSPGNSHASSDAEGCRPQLQEARAALEYLKSVAHETHMPFLILDMYLHMAELHRVENELDDALQCWRRARDIFMFLFVDGVHIPMLRVASIPWVRRIDSVISRLVRFLWTCDRKIINENLLLLDMYTLFTMEKDRAFRRGTTLSRGTRRICEGNNLNPILRGDNGGESHDVPPPSPVKTTPARRRSLHQHVEQASLPEEYHMRIPETFAASPLEPLFHYSNAAERPDHVRISRHDGNRRLKDSDEPAKDTKSTLANLFAPPPAVSPHISKAGSGTTATTPTSAPSTPASVVPPSPFKGRKTATTTSSTPSSRPTSLNQATTNLKANRPSHLFSPIDMHDDAQMALRYPWSLDHSRDARTMTGDLEKVLLKNSWRCCTLMDKAVQAYHTQGLKFEQFQDSMKQLTRVLTVLMKRTRRLTAQYTLEELSYDHVLETSAQVCQSEDTETTALFERVQRLVYALQVDDMLLFYHPHVGRRHVEHLAPGAEQESLFRVQLERESSLNEPQDASCGQSLAVHTKSISAASHGTSTTIGDTTDHSSTRGLLPVDICQMMVDYAIVINENACGGGMQERQVKLLRAEGDTFRALGRFMRNAAMTDQKDIAGEESERLSLDHAKPRRRQSSTGLAGSKIKSSLRAWFHGKPTERTAPVMPSPLTLVCSKTTHWMPWEALFPEVVMVRSLCLVALHAGTVNTSGMCGPSKHTHPEYFGICQGLSTLPGRVQQEARVRDLHRRIGSSIRAIRSLKHPVEPIIQANTAVFQTPLPRLQLGNHTELAAVHQSIADQCDDRVWPAPSPFLPFGKNTPQSTRSTRLKRVHYFDIMNGLNASPTSLVGWLDNYIVPAKSFPLLFLTYSDLNEMSDAVLYLLATRKDTVVVFIPYFCAASIAKEISSAVDKWCYEQTNPPATKSYSSTQSDGRAATFESGTDYDSEVPRISESSPSLSHRHALHTADTRSDYSGSGKSRVYDAVMDTIVGFIAQHAVPIVVFNL